MQQWDIEAILFVCHWNLNSIWVEDFSKLSQISTFLNAHQFDIFRSPKVFLYLNTFNDSVNSVDISKSKNSRKYRKLLIMSFQKKKIKKCTMSIFYKMLCKKQKRVIKLLQNTTLPQIYITTCKIWELYQKYCNIIRARKE